MKLRASGREVQALVPWAATALVWLGFVAPMRAEQGNRLGEQSQIRRDRMKADRSLKDIGSLRSRVAAVLSSSCRAPADPAAVRQMAVAATAGLPLSSFTLSVGGGVEAGAAVEAEGSKPAVMELMRRLGDPRRGGFLRSVSLRDQGRRWSASATTGVLEGGGAGMAGTSCAGVEGPVKAFTEPVPSPAPPNPRPARPQTPLLKAPEPAASSPSPEPTPGPPFSLVAFLRSDGKNRVSVRLGDEVRVLTVGDQIDGWICLSIDRDEGAFFSSARNARVLLKATH